MQNSSIILLHSIAACGCIFWCVAIQKLNHHFLKEKNRDYGLVQNIVYDMITGELQVNHIKVLYLHPLIFFLMSEFVKSLWVFELEDIYSLELDKEGVTEQALALLILSLFWNEESNSILSSSVFLCKIPLLHNRKLLHKSSSNFVLSVLIMSKPMIFLPISITVIVANQWYLWAHVCINFISEFIILPCDVAWAAVQRMPLYLFTYLGGSTWQPL